MKRTGTLGRRPLPTGGGVLLFMSDGEWALVEPEATLDEVAARFDLVHVEYRAEVTLKVCCPTLVDGPLAGQHGYATPELGTRFDIRLPPGPGGPVVTYELFELSEDGRTGKARLVT